MSEKVFRTEIKQGELPTHNNLTDKNNNAPDANMHLLTISNDMIGIC